MSAKYGYIGNNPSDTSVVVAKQVFAPTGVQTTFTFVSGYSIGYLDVYINGARQVEGQDYNATDTSTVGLSSAAQGGDIIELVAYKAFNVATVDTIPGDLRVQGKLTVVGLTTGSNAFYSGIVTATSFSGDGSGLTGISSVSFATTSFGLSGSPNITVGFITATEFDISGSSNTLNASGLNVGIATATTFVGALTGNATGLSGSPSITVAAIVGSGLTISGVSTLSDLRLSSIADKTTIVSGNSVSLAYNTGGGNVAICTNPSGPITLNVTGIPTDSSFDNRAISFAVIVNQGTTAYGCTNVSLNGVAFGANATVGLQTHIAYAGGTVAAGSTTGFDVFNFTGINTTGSASTTTNYKLLSNVSGGYRRY